MSLFQSIVDNIPSFTKKYVNRQIGFAATVADKLQSVGMTQRELAEKLGKKESYISRVLSGEANPTLKTIAELEVALGEDIIMFHQKNKVTPMIMLRDSFKIHLTDNNEVKAA